MAWIFAVNERDLQGLDSLNRRSADHFSTLKAASPWGPSAVIYAADGRAIITPIRRNPSVNPGPEHSAKRDATTKITSYRGSDEEKFASLLQEKEQRPRSKQLRLSVERNRNMNEKVAMPLAT